ncbi:hypothetical protein BG015_006698, partial [Linnemannia schmuckeri]
MSDPLAHLTGYTSSAPNDPSITLKENDLLLHNSNNTSNIITTTASSITTAATTSNNTNNGLIPSHTLLPREGFAPLNESHDQLQQQQQQQHQQQQMNNQQPILMTTGPLQHASHVFGTEGQILATSYAMEGV